MVTDIVKEAQTSAADAVFKANVQRVQAVKNAVFAPTFHDDAEYKAWQEGIKADLPEVIKNSVKPADLEEYLRSVPVSQLNQKGWEKAKALRHMSDALWFADDVRAGALAINKNSQADRMVDIGVIKNKSELLTDAAGIVWLPGTQTLVTNNDWDGNWALAFDNAGTAYNRPDARVPHVFTLSKFKELGAGQNLEYRALGYEDMSVIKPRKYGDGVQMDQYMFDAMPATRMNQAVTALRIGAEAMKSTIGYTALAACYAGTTTAAGTAPEQLLSAANTAVYTLLARFTSSTKKVVRTTPNTPILLYVRPGTNSETFRAVSRAVWTYTGAASGTLALAWPSNIRIIESYEIATNVAGTTTGGLLIIPGGKSLIVDFQKLKMFDEVNNTAQVVQVGAYFYTGIECKDSDQGQGLGIT